MKITGKVSTFGGKDDTGMSVKEGLALFEPQDAGMLIEQGLILAENPSRFGLGRRLNPAAFYIACRWSEQHPEPSREFLRSAAGTLVNEKTGVSVSGVRPVDWGPNVNTGRAMDLSPGLAKAAGLDTDDVASFVLDVPGEAAVSEVSVDALPKPMPKNPPQSQATQVFGKVEYGINGKPTDRWEARTLTTLDLPYKMRLSWDLSQTVRRISCNRNVKASLATILKQILDYYGSIEAVQAARMDLYGGCYNFRSVRGGQTLSQHAYGAAIDLDPEHNELGNPHGTMPKEVIAIFERNGWTWGGGFSRPDPMHFQFLSI